MGLRIEVRSGWGEGESEQLTFDQTRVVIGRRSGSDVQLPHPAVSGHHATIRVDGRRCTIVDERSTNGVRLNGERLTPGRAKAVAEGDEVALGGFFLSIVQEAVGGSATAESTRAVARRLLIAQEGEVEGPRLSFVNGRRAGESVTLAEPPSSLVAGRGAALDLPDGDASREHAEFLHELAGVRVRDLGSKNGVEVRGKRVENQMLRHGDEIVLGATRLRFDDPAEPALEALVSEEDQALAPDEIPAPPTDSPVEEASLPPQPEDLGPTSPPRETERSLVDARPSEDAERGDVVVYALAGAVLALSLAGLFWLVSQ